MYNQLTRSLIYPKTLNHLGKMVTVKSVYVPPIGPTGMRRNFAILQCEGKAENDISNCARKLNKCHWRGCKLSIEM